MLWHALGWELLISLGLAGSTKCRNMVFKLCVWFIVLNLATFSLKLSDWCLSGRTLASIEFSSNYIFLFKFCFDHRIYIKKKWLWAVVLMIEKAFFFNLIFLFLIILQPGLSVNGREKGGINCWYGPNR